MNSNTIFEIIYIKKKYIELGLMDENEKKSDVGWFNPNIFPEEGYIPLCSECKTDFEMFKKMKITNEMEVEWNHLVSCLWYDYFISKVKQICKTAQIVRKNNKK
jgi:hypothetical protein